MTEEKKSEKNPGRQKKNILLKAAVVVFLLMVGVVTLLPSILSMDSARKFAVDKVNSMGNGTLSIGSWSFSWFSGIFIKDLTFEDRQGVSIKVEQVKTSRGIAGMIGRTIDIGTLVVSSPDFVTVVKQQQVPADPLSTGVKPDQNDQL